MVWSKPNSWQRREVTQECVAGKLARRQLTTKKEFTDLKYEPQDRNGGRSELFWKECERE
jgi:hypothetical protein